jgi:hypothetical protein
MMGRKRRKEKSAQFNNGFRQLVGWSVGRLCWIVSSTTVACFLTERRRDREKVATVALAFAEKTKNNGNQNQGRKK